MGSSEGQTYCLRWNNHKSNLVEILDALIKMECYVDCTIYVDDQVQFKAHRVVLAANSPYFQTILQDVPMDHCSILFPGVQEFEMRALLEYMYTGEVNVTQAQIPRIMKIAEQLEVKGLYDMADLKGRFDKMGDVDHLMRDRDPATTLLASNNNYTSKASSGSASASGAAASASSSSWKDTPPTGSSGGGGGASSSSSHYSHHHQHQSSPVISTSTNISIAQSSSSSPPYSYKSPYSSLYSRSPGTVERDREREERTRDRSSSFSHTTSTSPHRIQSTSGSSASSVSAQIALQSQATGGNHHQSVSHQSTGSSSSASSAQPSTAAAAAALAAGWPGLGQTQLHSMLSSAYDSSTDMNPLKRKKLQSMSSMLRDTPILRNVLAQANPADSSQSAGGGVSGAGATATSVATIQTIQSGIKSDPERPSSHHSNGSGYKSIKEPSHSPYADKSFDDDLLDSPHAFGGDARLASYVPHQQQKPEWKRYKQYTRTDILNAIECVRKGMSALQASRKFGVPSRTLYDKVKKLGITTGRPINRALKRSPSSGSSPASFPYGLSGASHMFGPGSGAPPHGGDHHQQLPSQSQQQDEEASQAAAAAAAAAAAMAHHEAGRMIKLEHGSHHGLPPTIPHPAAALLDPSFLQQALEARGGDIAGREALHAMAFAAAAHAAVNGMSTSPGTHGTARSPSPSVLMKYMRSVSMSSPEDDRHHPVQQRERDLAEGHRDDRHHHNGSDPVREVYARSRDLPMEQDSIDDGGSECEERPPSGPGIPTEGQDDHVEDLSMGPKRDSEERRDPSVSPPPSTVVRAVVQQRSRSPSPQPPPPPPPSSHPPQQQGVIVPAPGKLKEDYNISIKREIIADSNAPSESS
uniref:BTB domain-containing protein n=1 Tax=Anopheles farauti TaxID=69004 RepID=A0A182Q824_9DIPT